ncbi:hypothetical protein AVEN_166631-1 [Araneus ventricosus]|uniref:Mos1 transposase HTH domain-containing protein n=1 Tax=Araneus ventricosus TaxID=182803 RepID=A0A4Y2MGF3_ARAVE|nr:hypothetical protein AVEN_166631-1 [Araneus ventricosus]
MSSLEQRVSIKFCVLLEKEPSETLEMLKKSYGNDAMKETAVYEWQKRFREGRTNIEDDPRTGSWHQRIFNLFPRLKMKLKGHRFADSDEVIENATKQLKDLSKNGFQKCFEQLYERCKKCVDAGGKYFEGQ